MESPEIYTVEKAKEKDTFIVKSSKEEWNLSFQIVQTNNEEKKEALKMSIYLTDSVPRTVYSVEKDMKELKEICVVFSIFPSIKGMLNSMEKVILKENGFALKVEKEKITILMKFNSDFFEGDVDFDLTPEKRSTEDDVKCLIEEIGNLRKENKEIKKQINKFLGNNDSEKSSNELVEAREEIKKLKEKIEELEKNSPTYDRLMKSENIFLEEEKELMAKWIDPSKKITFKLLYKAASSQGESASNFHSYCNGKGPTVTIIMTQKGNRFGGYTSLSWSSSGGYRNDTNAFIFNLDTKQQFKNKKNNNAIYDNSSYGPSFGSGYDISVYDGCISSNNRSSYCNPGTTYEGATKENISGGYYNYRIEDYEVYLVAGL